MRKLPIFSGARALAVGLLIALLAACGGRDDLKGNTSDATNAPVSYDLTILADKDGQFDFDGATLTPEDLRDHIRFLNDAGKPVHALLLKRGEKEKIKNTHVAALASISRDLKLQAYVEDNDGRLKVIQVVE